MSQPAIRPRLMQMAARLRFRRALGVACEALAIVLGAVLAGVILDHLLPLPGGLRLALALVLAALAAAVGLACARAARRLPPEAVAQRIEDLLGPGLGNAVIGACQFETEAGAGRIGASSLRWLGPTAALAGSAIGRVPATRLYELGRLARSAAWAVLALTAALAYAAIWPDHARHGLQRLLLPLADLPPLGQAIIRVDPQGSLAVPDGGSLSLRIVVRGVDGAPAPTLPPEALISEGEAPAAGGEGLRSAVAADGQQWRLDLADLRRSCSLRLVAAGTWTPLISVRVDPPPRLLASSFTVDGPAYSGISGRVLPGPPADLVVLPGSRLRCSVSVGSALAALRLQLPGLAADLSSDDGRTWSAEFQPVDAGDYVLAVPGGGALARGALRLASDAAPQAALPGVEANRFCDPGAELGLDIAGEDDLGLASLALEMREAVEGARAEPLKEWRYLGPPGPTKAREALRLVLDPRRFLPGHAYLLQAVARDRRPPGGQTGRSTAVLLRIRSLSELGMPPGDPRAGAFERLRRCLAEQLRARAAAGSVRANLPDIRAHQGLARQAKAAADPQAAAREAGAEAAKALDQAKEGVLAVRLRPLVDPGMSSLVADLGRLADDAGLDGRLESICARQDELIAALSALLGQLAGAARSQEQTPAPLAANMDADRRKAAELAADLKRFIDDQQKILDRSRSLAERGGADLGADEQRILGELAKSEKEWAKFLEEKLTDFGRNPPQDFSDGSLSTETNAVWQDVKLAADALSKKAVELAVPREQSGLELAEKLENNIEKWLADAPDKTSWKMEDAPAPADVPTAELPKELEDIVGELLDKQEAMTEDVQDASSQWMDSIDKGAGWGTGDGPISNMSAKGVTGNVLPNQNEVGGRSGEGRNGRSNGQMVQDAAEGKGGQETPTRLSQTPFEQGSVKDSSKEQLGGATGGGKLSGFDAEGLRGPTAPPELRQAMARLAGKQQAIRQQAETLALQLRKQHLPSGGVENAAAAMAAAEEAARRFDVRALRQAHSGALDALAEAHRSMAGAGAVQVERSQLGPRARSQLDAHRNDPVPAGYEDMVGRYFQALAGAQP